MISLPLLLLLLHHRLLPASASCADLCSGHGSCGKKDKCICQNGFTGLTCAGRTCLYGHSWGGTPYAHDLLPYSECSNAGLCDRKSGLCKCSPGFSGAGCRRLLCPNGCSGHGVCSSMAQLAKDTSPMVNGKFDRKYEAWDRHMSQACKCDPSYTGADCSRRMCSSGDDPMTNHTDYHTIATGGVVQVTVQENEVQKLQINGIHDISGNFVLQYTDQFNGQWKTRPIRVENNVGTTKKLLLMASNADSSFSGATYAGKKLNAWGSAATSTPAGGTTHFFCPFGDPACQQECPFGLGYKMGDRLQVTGTTSQTEQIFDVLEAGPCKLVVTPAPQTITTAETTVMKVLSSGKGVEPLTGVGGVLQGLRALPNQVIPDISVTERLKFNSRKEFDITFNHQDNAGDQKNLQCDPIGCDVDGCQPRFQGLKKSLAVVVLNAFATGTYHHHLTFTTNSETNDDTIVVGNGFSFANRLKGTLESWRCAFLSFAVNCQQCVASYFSLFLLYFLWFYLCLSPLLFCIQNIIHN